MKKKFVAALTLITLLLGIGYGIKRFSTVLPSGEVKDVIVLNELPFNIEPNNPVPEVRYWNQDGRTFYYFNWGLKKTGGYSLELVGVKNNKIKIRAITPDKNLLVIQVLNYPYLLISLPDGTYHYEVIDRNGKRVTDIFTPQNEPLKIMLFLPGQDQIAARQVLREPYLNNEGKTKAQIALEALFAQDEMTGFVNNQVMVKNVSVSIPDNKWIVLMNPGFDTLKKKDKDLLTQLITKTTLALNVAQLNMVEITTDPAKLPMLEN